MPHHRTRTPRLAGVAVAAALSLTALAACGDDSDPPPITDPPSSERADNRSSTVAPTTTPGAPTTTTAPPLVTVPGPVTDEDLRYTDALVVSFAEIMRQLVVNPSRALELMPPVAGGELRQVLEARAYEYGRQPGRFELPSPDRYRWSFPQRQVQDSRVLYLVCVIDGVIEREGEVVVRDTVDRTAATLTVERTADGWRATGYRVSPPDEVSAQCP